MSLRLEDVDLPEPGPGELAIRVEATVVNFADILLCQGVYQDRPGVPMTPGLETCGTVVATGEGTPFAVGTRVVGMASLPWGGFAEGAFVKAPSAAASPPDIPAADATVLWGTYMTAHTALHRRANLQPGETLLVHGAAGGVGSAAVQLGAAAGATVIATVGGADKVDVARRLGAHHVIDHTTTDVRTAVKDLTAGRGVDVAYDPVGGALGDTTRSLMAWEGRLLVIGFASGDIPTYPANHILVKNYSVIGLHWGAYADHGGRAAIDEAHADLERLYRGGLVDPLVTATVGLDGLPDALDALEHRRVIGRVVLTP